jgi:hypothetical protein
MAPPGKGKWPSRGFANFLFADHTTYDEPILFIVSNKAIYHQQSSRYASNSTAFIDLPVAPT